MLKKNAYSGRFQDEQRLKLNQKHYETFRSISQNNITLIISLRYFCIDYLLIFHYKSVTHLIKRSAYHSMNMRQDKLNPGDDKDKYYRIRTAFLDVDWTFVGDSTRIFFRLGRYPVSVFLTRELLRTLVF